MSRSPSEPMSAATRDNLQMALLYNAGQLLLSPALAAYLGYRILIQGKSRAGFAQRLGFVPELGPPPAAGRVWLQAVSAGEVAAAAPVIRRLRERPEPPEVVLSTTTPAGCEQADRLGLDLRARIFFPFDFWPCVTTALRRLQPTVIASVETEIWPNWLLAARRRGIPAALVNGRFSDRGFGRARRLRAFYRWPLQKLDALQLQTDRDAERARLLGAPPDRLAVAGNTKFDQNLARLEPAAAAALRRELGLEADAPLLIAGSTHPGEEALVLDAYAALRVDRPRLQLLIAPRHLNRADDVERLIRERGHACLRRTRARPSDPPRDAVRLLDTMGELARVYGIASAAFVGGSLAPIGGHDVLQPVFHGVPTLFGPHMRNQRDLAAGLLAADAALRVADADSLRDSLARCLDDDALRARLAQAGAAFVQRHAGAARAAADLLARLADREIAP